MMPTHNKDGLMSELLDVLRQRRELPLLLL
jgi:hypothetical protein